MTSSAAAGEAFATRGQVEICHPMANGSRLVAGHRAALGMNGASAERTWAWLGSSTSRMSGIAISLQTPAVASTSRRRRRSARSKDLTTSRAVATSVAIASAHSAVHQPPAVVHEQSASPHLFDVRVTPFSVGSASRSGLLDEIVIHLATMVLGGGIPVLRRDERRVESCTAKNRLATSSVGLLIRGVRPGGRRRPRRRGRRRPLRAAPRSRR